MMIYVLKIYYIKKMSSLLKIVLKISMSHHDGLQINHHTLNNVYQNELERNSLDVDSPHCRWQIGPRLKSFISPLPLHLDVLIHRSERSRVVEVHCDAKYCRQCLHPANERSLLTVRVCEERLVVEAKTGSRHWICDPILSFLTSSLGNPAFRKRHDALQAFAR
jgi:hypothetical protein